MGMSGDERENDMDRIRCERRKQSERAAGIAISFLQKLRPGGPWMLVAIMQYGKSPVVRTVSSAAQVKEFIHEHNGLCNLYYSVNPTRTAMNKKAEKTDIAAIEYALADL